MVDRRGGGVLTYIRNSISYHRLSILECDEVESLCLLVRDKCMPRNFAILDEIFTNINNLYVPPNCLLHRVFLITILLFMSRPLHLNLTLWSIHKYWSEMRRVNNRTRVVLRYGMFKTYLEKSFYRGENLSRKFFTAIKSASHKLHHTLPKPKFTWYSSVIHQITHPENQYQPV